MITHSDENYDKRTLCQNLETWLVPVLTASLASCTAIFDNPEIFSAVFTASFTSSSAGNTLLTKPADEKVHKILSQIA